MCNASNEKWQTTSNWKILIAQIKKKSMTYLKAADYFRENRKGSTREEDEQATYCTKISTSSKWQNKAKNVSMLWINNKMTYVQIFCILSLLNQFAPKNIDNRMSENVYKNIRQSHKLHYENYERLLSGINNRRTIPSRSKHHRNYLLERTTHINATNISMMPFNYIVYEEVTKFTKSQAKMNHFKYIDNVKLFEKRMWRKKKRKKTHQLWGLRWCIHRITFKKSKESLITTVGNSIWHVKLNN